ncbi:NagE protein [Actinobacillus succinogenes]|uniref:PTS system glucose-specific EIIA component n=1 Tax=Actinobacillus succinogenes (strain ATCC 55618 / DSM 22257 / CCUG 43843 / 130Z) TaxID=339671 RepID=A6VKL0_ACTSZ|nr:PTS glucose transporter subunit IIA [Actinobacillus succinogenes]ABR73507.1 PTS system, glucose subfamily, IIA subunit [Actinobacillus succinogenes 130Z]PHI40030.1 NagE protein [Actinobacillus succinogenes]
MSTDFIIPMSGKLVSLEQVPDETFCQKKLGDGFAVILQGEVVVSPISGVVIAAFPTGHAFIIRREDGLEVLIHIGLNSAAKSEAFRMQIEKYQEIERGDVLVYIDRQKLGDTEADLVSPIVFANPGIRINLLKSEQDVLVGDPDAVSVSL